ncbi:MAG: hypothetical protein B7Y40_04885 [Gammaproteobacteria bacterium 28-57-27]|nr:MAG: hypothetical protein B7Y40_04885 [Gammaproteobacteria bacterium 28-57-27]
MAKLALNKTDKEEFVQLLVDAGYPISAARQAVYSWTKEEGLEYLRQLRKTGGFAYKTFNQFLLSLPTNIPQQQENEKPMSQVTTPQSNKETIRQPVSPIEQNPIKRKKQGVSVAIDPDIREQLEAIAEREDLTLSIVIRKALRFYLNARIQNDN